MASLRDVFNHAGKKVRLVAPGGLPREGLGIRRGETALLEAKLVPKPDETLEFVDTKELFRVVGVEAELFREKVDHYRARLGPVVRG